MARVLVASDTDPRLFVELTGGDDDSDWDGRCSRCAYTTSEGGTRFSDLADATQAAIVHIDHQH
jgi:hypothetical protein